ncbi:hypothetical protein WEI85_05755 [Actinomycetes bacterium KLBMP 9797]
MRALHVPAAGAQPELGDLPVPEVAPGHVLIRVKAVGLNPFDNMILPRRTMHQADRLATNTRRSRLHTRAGHRALPDVLV